ncbi:MAG: polysulfide reductase NrfD [bacterium]|nr:polysulfide reductase NrfD [bacterium]
MIRRVLYTLSVILLFAGIYGFYDRLFNGHINANYGSYVVWGLWVSLYLFFAGVSSGSFVVASFDYLFKIGLFRGLGKTALWVCIVSLLAAVLFIWIDLGHMWRVWRVYVGNPNSLMFQMVWGYTFFGIVAVFSLLYAIKNPESKFFKFLLVLGVFLSIFVSGAVGALFGVNASVPFWHVGLFPVQFPVFSLASAIALMLVLVALFGLDFEVERKLVGLSYITTGLLIIKLYFLWADYSQSMYGSIPANVLTIKAILYGKYWWVFWFVILILTSIFPIVFLIQKRFASSRFFSGVMGLLVLIGYAIARGLIVFPPLTIPQIEGLAEAYTGRHLLFEYFPSLMEWSVTSGIIGFSIVVFLIGSNKLKLFEYGVK